MCVLGQWQTRMFQRDRQLSPLQMMLIMNAFSTVFSFVTVRHPTLTYLTMPSIPYPTCKFPEATVMRCVA